MSAPCVLTVATSALAAGSTTSSLPSEKRTVVVVDEGESCPSGDSSPATTSISSGDAMKRMPCQTSRATAANASAPLRQSACRRWRSSWRCSSCSTTARLAAPRRGSAPVSCERASSSRGSSARGGWQSHSRSGSVTLLLSERQRQVVGQQRIALDVQEHAPLRVSQAALGGRQRDAERGSDVVHGQALDVAERKGSAISHVQAIEYGVEALECCATNRVGVHDAQIARE